MPHTLIHTSLFPVSFRSIHLILLLLLSLFFSCRKDDDEAADTAVPVITSISPARAYIGDTVTINGQFFESYREDNLITFNGKLVGKYIDGNATQIRVVIPAGSTAGPVLIDAGGRRGPGFMYEVIDRGTTIFSITPDNTEMAPVGSVVEVRGKGFLANDLLVGKAFFYFTQDLPATIISASDTLLRVTVPQRVKTGPVRLDQEGFSISGPVFSYVGPIITSVNPTECTEGMKITLTGAKLQSIADLLQNSPQELGSAAIFINGKQAIINPTTITDTQLEIEIPAGTGTGTFPVVVGLLGTLIEMEATITVKPLSNIVRTVYYLNTTTGYGIPYRLSVDNAGTVYNARLSTIEGFICLAPDRANGKVYYGYYDQLYVSNLDGTDFKRLFENSAVGFGYPVDMTVANGKIYWTDGITNQIRSANADGTGNIQVLFGDDPNAPLNFAFGIEVEGNKVYWTEAYDRQLMRGNLDGSGEPEEIKIGGVGLQFPEDVDIETINGKTYAYIVDRADYGGVGIAWGEINGTNINLSSLNTLTPEVGAISNTSYLDVNPATQKVYWGNNYSPPYKLMQSDWNGNTVTTVASNELYPYTSFFTIE